MSIEVMLQRKSQQGSEGRFHLVLYLRSIYVSRGQLRPVAAGGQDPIYILFLVLELQKV